MTLLPLCISLLVQPFLLKAVLQQLKQWRRRSIQINTLYCQSLKCTYYIYLVDIPNTMSSGNVCWGFPLRPSSSSLFLRMSLQALNCDCSCAFVNPLWAAKRFRAMKSFSCGFFLLPDLDWLRSQVERA